MFEPKTFPTESAAPPDKAAINATVNSGNEVEKAIKLNPTAVFPSWVTLDTFNSILYRKIACPIQHNKRDSITIMSITKP